MSRDRAIYLRHVQDLIARIKRYPSIPWVQIAAFRNILAHKYLGVDMTLVWEIIVRDLPALESTVNMVVDGLSGP